MHFMGSSVHHIVLFDKESEESLKAKLLACFVHTYMYEIMTVCGVAIDHSTMYCIYLGSWTFKVICLAITS